MTGKTFFTIGLAAATCLALPATAFAEGKTDQAQKAIAGAKAKIDAMTIVGATGDAPRLHAEAVTSLHVAEDELAHHAKADAIRDASHASDLADQALAASQRERANEQRASADAAQQQANDANARAAAAQAAAAAAQADAAAARAAPPVIIAAAPAPAPAPSTTTVSTTQAEQTTSAAPAPRRKVVRKTVSHRPVATHTEKTTTTTVTTK